ncbi:HvfC/BufC family peptide modification chaperone [Hydrogenimonas urashimensis]|uniref:HvfC/BufC family peptide modification chaperone n=1 Tax=Hydrogenimonas urashimensis TaxID=2740515 RepID=UPI0019165587|nr:putative DNA-binding domain-containing protein [Hydrogenimonas urashimensis]
MMAYETMQRFFEAIREGRAAEYRHGDIYEQLVRYRFDEALGSTFPRFRSRIGEARWTKLLRRFIASGSAHSPFVWQMASDFRQSVQKGIDRPLRHLLWFEWQEVALTRLTMPKRRKIAKVDFSKRYRLGKRARLKKLVCDVSDEDNRQIGVYWTLVWQTFSGESAWMRLTPFMGELLAACDGKNRLGKTVGTISPRFRIRPGDARDILKEGLLPLLASNIVV